MFAIGPILLEVFFVLVKPQELYPGLQAFQPLYTLPLLVVLGFVFDVGRFGLRFSRMVEAPFLRISLALFAWSLLTVARWAPADIVNQAILFGTSLLMALAIAHAVQTMARFEGVAAAILALTLLFAAVGDEQAFAPKRCHYIDAADRTIQHYDGRPCESVDECRNDQDADPDKEYVCERAGWLGTSTVTDRIRFRGNLEDPNELSLTAAIGLPIAFALFQRKKTLFRTLLLVAALALVVACVYFSQSRGGQVVLLVVLGAFFLRRLGVKRGLIVAAVAAVPVIYLASTGSRSSTEAEGSSLERIETLAVGVDLIRFSPIWGIGKGQFGEYHYLTAHNAYVLAAAELGFVGFALFSATLYLAMKTPITALRALEDRDTEGARAARVWSTAMFATLSGTVVGIFFLSFTFHPILWIYIGLSGALFATVRAELPDFRVRLRLTELVGLVFADVFLILAVFVYTKLKL